MSDDTRLQLIDQQAATDTPSRSGGQQPVAPSSPSVLAQLSTHGITAESPQ